MRNRDWLFIFAGLILGTLLGVLVTHQPAPSTDNAATPKDALPPESVVRRQLAALQRAVSDEAAIEECYRYASPANREAVGSAEDFARLLESAEYRPLIGHQRHLLGKPVFREGFATLLATVIGQDGVPTSFRFVLERQSDANIDGHWMTSGVYAIPRYRGNPVTPSGSPVAPSGRETF